MASINQPPLSSENQEAWNEAYERLTHYLDGFVLGNRAHASRLALELLDQARELHRQDSSRHPTRLTMEMSEKHLTDWLATNLDERDKPPAEVLADGCIALLLSRVFRTAPDSFLGGPLPEELRQALRETLLVTGPDLNMSRMTPRHLDYGPMLHLARQTWHRWDLRELLVALFFWAGVYALFYWWLSNYSL